MEEKCKVLMRRIETRSKDHDEVERLPRCFDSLVGPTSGASPSFSLFFLHFGSIQVPFSHSSHPDLTRSSA